MKLAIVARRTPTPEPQHDRYRQEALRRGHAVVDVDVASFITGPVDVDVRGPWRIGDARLDDVDVVLLGPLPGAAARTTPTEQTTQAKTQTQYERHLLAWALVEELEARGVPMVSAPSSAVFDNKARQLFALARAGIPIPATRFTDAPVDEDVVVKGLHSGPARVGVAVQRGRPVIAQQRQRGADLRAVVVDGRCACAASFPGSDDVVDVRERPAFVDGSARWQRVDDAAVEAVAVEAARVCGFAVAAVDLKRTNQGIVVLEVNRTPVVCDVQDDLGIDLPALVVDLLERRAKVVR